MQTVLAPTLIDRSDCNPPAVYRIMTPCFSGKITNYSAVSSGINSWSIPGVTPAVPTGIWAQNSRMLGVRNSEVLPPNPPISGSNSIIYPATVPLAGGGMSVLPVLVTTLLPNHRVPRRNGGTGTNVDCWFSLERNVIIGSANLRIYFDLGDNNNYITHGVIEPAMPMPPVNYVNFLSATASSWICINM